MTAGTHTLVARDADSLLKALPIEDGAVRSRRIFKGTGASVMRLALDQGQIMKEHTAAAPILVQVLSGAVNFEVEGKPVDLPTGAIIHVDAQVPHSVEAVSPAQLLLILCERSPSKGMDSQWVEIEAAPTHDDATHGSAGAAAQCECGVVDEPDLPELDVRTVPHAIRHATVFGALDGLGAGDGLILVAPHDPLPLLAQIEQRAPGRFSVSYLDRGPESWRLQLIAAPSA